MKICTAGAMRGWAGLDVSSLDAIDVHTHVHRSVSAPASAPAGESLAAMATYFKTGPAAYTVDELAAYYRDQNMAAVVFTVDVAGEPEDPSRPTNEEIAERARANADVIIPFASVDPARGRAGVRIAQRLIEEHGVRGFKFHPSAQGFRPNDRAAYPLYEVIEAAGLPALFHTGQTGAGAGRPGGGGIRLGYSNPMYLDDVAVDFPDLPIILAHPSFPWQEEALAVATHKPQVYIDLSGWSPKYFPPILVQYANTVLRHKMLFGTDFPMLTPQRWRSDLDKTAIRDEVKPDLYKNNAARLLGLD
jgi:predicted TIM-barrel fold metal-dependent hydrolase